MKIHFASLVGVDYELDILPFWLKYYKERDFDTRKLFLHRETGRVPKNVIDEACEAGYEVECCDGPQANGMLRKLILGNYAASLPPDDYLVLADADEYQSAPRTVPRPPGTFDYMSVIGPEAPDPIDYRADLEKYDLVCGNLVDRYGKELSACYQDPFIQYPYEEYAPGDLLKGFTPPYLRKSKWPVTRRAKILAARCGAPLAYEGSHGTRYTPSDYRIAWNYRVVHFAWRESTKGKIAVKSYFNEKNLEEIFKGAIPEKERQQIRSMSHELLSGVTP
jgi:hypothetical protein